MANNREEYAAADEELIRIEGVYNTLVTKRDTAQAAFDMLSGTKPGLQTAYDDAKDELQAHILYIKTEGDIDLPPYDPSAGPPSLPEEADASSTTGSGTSGSTTGSGTSGSGTSGSTTGGSGSGTTGGSGTTTTD
jgi:uncharacterized membrane protein YgcG